MNTMTAQTNPLGTEKIHKLILKYSVPCVISMLVNSIYNIVDQIFIGQKIGYLGTGATNVAFPLVTLSMAIALLIGDGQAANFSLKLGRNKKEDAEKSLGNAVTL
ncbi:MAG: MATE family efflux transporter, partial [Oscillospiraceae bacterium]